MRAWHGQWVQQDGFVVKTVAPWRSLGNILTLVFEQARFSAEEPGFEWGAERELFEMAAASRQDFFNFVFSGDTTVKGGIGSLRGQNLDILMARFFGTTGATEAFAPQVRALLWSLQTPRVVRSDWGRCMEQDIVEARDATMTSTGWGVSPATGWERPSLISSIPFIGVKSMYSLPHPNSPQVKAAALIMMRIDCHRRSFDLFKPPAAMDSSKANARIFETAKVMRHLADDIFAFYNMYRVSAQRLLFATNSRLRALGRSEYRRRYGSRHRDLDLISEEAENEFLTLPAHTLARLFEQAYSTGTNLSAIGEHDTHYATGSTADLGSAETEVLAFLSGARTTGSACAGYTAAAACAAYEDHLTSISLAAGAGACQSKAWSWKTTADAGTRVTPLEMLASLKSDPDLLSHIKDKATGMHWGTIPVNLGHLDFLAADFAVSDGVHLTCEPDAAAFGLVPVLSLGNKEAWGITARYIDDFKPLTIPFSVVPIRGRLDVTGAPEYLERRTIPYSMTMGETSLRPANAAGMMPAADKVAAALIDHYDRRASRYLKPFYGRLEVPADWKEVVTQSQWDPEGYSGAGERDLVKKAWAGTITGDDISTPARSALYAEREGDLLFYGRAIVLPSVTDTCHILNAEGLYATTETPNHFVFFLNEFNLPYDCAVLEKYLALAPLEAQRSKVLDVTVENLNRVVDK